MAYDDENQGGVATKSRDPRDDDGFDRHSSGQDDGSQDTTGDSSYAPSGQNTYDNDSDSRSDPVSRRKRGRKDLKADEEGANTGGSPSKGKQLAAGGLGSLINSEKAPQTPFSYSGGKSGSGNFLKKHGKKLLAGSLAGVGALPILALLIFMLGALKIPHFVENVAAWRFAKVTRQYRVSMQNVMNEKNVIDTLDDADKEKVRGKYGRFPVFDKVNRLRPNKVLQSLNANDRIQYNYKKTLTGKQKLVSITVAPEETARTKITIDIPSGKFDRILHPFRTLNQYKTIGSALDSAMKAHDPKIPLLTRTLATRAVLKKAGASLKGMAAAKYLGKSEREAKIAIQQEAYEKSHRNGGVGAIGTENTREIASEADQEADKAMQDKTQVGDMVDKGLDVPDSVNDVIERGLNPGNLKAVVDKVVGFANPIYDIAVPICMAYDGSKITPEGVDADHDSMVNEAAFVLSTADQQKDGASFNTEAAGAMNWKLGNIQESNAIRRVSGKPVNTLDGGGGQRTPLGTYGDYTIFDVFGLGVLSGAANDLCPALTNLWVGIGIGVVNIGLIAVGSFFSGGAAGAAEATATKSAQDAASKALTTAVKKAISTATKKTIKSFAGGGRFAKAYAKSTVKYGAATAAAVFLASVIVNKSAGLSASGAETSVSFDDNVDNGMDQLSGDIGKANFYGRPLSNVEIAQSQIADRNEIAYNLSQQSTFERYLALENPNSLVSRMAITTGSLLDRSMFAALLNSLASLFNPVGMSAKLFGSMNAKTTIAAGSENKQDYGNVQWTYSPAELSLMQQDSYASPSENALRLADSGKEEEINGKYEKCYTSSPGTLLANGDIDRNEEGEITGGDCSPQNLGSNNSTYGDLVFRWRLSHNYGNMTDTLLNIQDPSAASGNSPATGSTDIPTGTTQQLAQQILNNGNITFQVEPTQRIAMQKIASTGRASTCGSPVVSPQLLGVILAAAKKYKIVLGVLVDGHECDGKFHPKGMAVDINGVNALDGSDGTNRNITATNYSSTPILKQFYGDLGGLIAQVGGGSMGQLSCFGAGKPAQNASINYFSGEPCDHLHIDVGKR